MSTEEWAIWVTAAATIATALCTAVLSVVTWLLWKSTQRMAAATSEPYVVVTLEPSRWSFIHLDLFVENTGTGPAFDVQIAFDPPLVRDDLDAKRVPLNRVSVVRPGQSIRDYVNNAAKLLAESYRVSVSWKGSPNAPTRTVNSYDLNLRHYEDLVQLGGGDPAVEVAQETKKLRESFDRAFLSSSHRVDIDVYTHGDRERERDARDRWIAEQRAQRDQAQPTEGDKPSPPGAKGARKPRPST